MSGEFGIEAAQFPEKEYINRIFLTVRDVTYQTVPGRENC